MPRRARRSKPKASENSTKQTKNASTETVAERTRQMAEMIARVAHEILDSFQLSGAEGVIKVQSFATQIYLGMSQIVGWLERNRPRGVAELMTRRLDHVLREAVQCAGLPIPEYEGGNVKQVPGGPSPGAVRVANLHAEAWAFAESLRGWADQIEAEENSRDALATQTPPAEPALDDEDLSILRALDKRPNLLLTRDQIAGWTSPAVGTKTIGKRIKGLLSHGLVKRPKGPKGGTAITENGRKLVESLRPKTTL
jgi:hypothetical protein